MARKAATNVGIPRRAKRPASVAQIEPPGKKRSKKQSNPESKDESTPSDEDDYELEEASSDADEGSGYEESEVQEESEEEPEPESSSEDEAPRRRKSAGDQRKENNAKSTPTSAKKGGTRLGPGTEVIMKKPRARSPGATPYRDGTIHPNTFIFLKELRANNNRQWLKAHDPDYRQSWKDFESFLEALTTRIAEIDETVPELPVKDIIFRIYRDVRFSKDPTPYKTHYGAAWSRTGRKGPYAVYYLQIAPSDSLIAGGYWMPEASALASLRREIDRRPERLKAILSSPQIRKEYLGGVGNNEKKVVERFVKEHASTSLKTKPKGFDSDHKEIDLLRLKNFTLHRKLKDEEVVGANALEHISTLVSHLVPFITYLNSVVKPDDPSDDEDEDEASEDEESEDAESD